MAVPDSSTESKWTAKWCWTSKHLLQPWNTYVYFRRTVDLKSAPRNAVVRVSADARYTLYVNGRRVHHGPARFFPAHPSFDTLDLVPLLKSGKNAICAIVHQYGIPTFFSQYRDQAGFILDGEIELDGSTQPLHTPTDWLTRPAKAWKKETARRSLQLGFQEHFDADADPPDWMLPQFVADEASGWVKPDWTLPAGAHPWVSFEPRIVPLLADHVEDFADIVATFRGKSGRGYKITPDVYHFLLGETRKKDASDFITEPQAMLSDDDAVTTIAPAGDGDFVAMTLNLQTYRTGHFMLDIAEAAGDEIIDIIYIERLDDTGFAYLWKPGQQCDVAVADRYRCRAGAQKWESFNYSGMQYAVLVFRNISKPLKVRHAAVRQVHAAIEDLGAFECSDDLLNRIWKVCRETQRNCAFDSFVDCPWREQAQWWGDARVQAKVTQYAFGDSTLLERGIRQVRQSQAADGSLHSHPPADVLHRLPDFALTWVDSVLDFYDFTGRTDVPAECMPAIHRVMEFFAAHEIKDGLVDRFDGFWLFLDWSEVYKGNVSSVLNLYYLRTLRAAAALSRLTNDPRGAAYEQKAATLQGTIEKYFWDPAAKQWRDGFDIEKNEPIGKLSQHAATLAILLGLQKDSHASIAREVLIKTSLGKRSDVATASSFFQAYVLQALNQLGLQRDALAIIKRLWGEMLKAGATACWEGFDGNGSRCHAWSASPLYHLGEQILGVQRIAPGWKKVRIAPNPCGLEFARGAVPTPFGLIKVEWESAGDDQFAVRVEVPEGIEAEFISPTGERRELDPGAQEFSA